MKKSLSTNTRVIVTAEATEGYKFRYKMISASIVALSNGEHAG